VLVVPPAGRSVLPVDEGLEGLEASEPPRRLVWMSNPPYEDRPTSWAGELVILELPELVEDSDDPSSCDAIDGPTVSIPVEQAAMAALRAGIEPDRAGRIDPSGVVELGRAVMIQ